MGLVLLVIEGVKDVFHVHLRGFHSGQYLTL